MKKAIMVFVLLAAIMLLPACTKTDGDKDTSDHSEPAFTLPLPTLDDDNNADTPDEGNVHEYGYLADAMFDTDETLPEYDIPVSYVGEYTFRQLYGYGDKIYTYTATDTYDGFISVTDKDTYESAPLCTVTGCEHTGEGCEAYIYGAVYGFRVYDGMLYWVQGVFDPSSAISLVRCSLDGTGREVLWSYDYEKFYNETGFNFIEFFNTITGSFSVLIHRGYIYLAGVSDHDINVACMPLEGGMPTVLASGAELGEVKGRDNASCRICISGNDIYIMMNQTEPDREYMEQTGYYLEYDLVSFYRFDTKTRTLSEIGGTIGEMRGTTNVNFDENAFFVVPGDGIYFFELYEYCIGDSYDVCDSTATLCRLSFDTGEVERVAKLTDGDFDSFFHVGFGDGVAEAHSLGNIYLFDLAGTLISKQVFLTEYDYPCVDVIGSDEDRIYISCKADGERFYIAAPMNGGDMERFSSYKVIEHEYNTILTFMDNSIHGEITVPVKSGDVILEYSASLTHSYYMITTRFFVDGIDDVPGIPAVASLIGGVAYARTNHGFEETVDEIRGCTFVSRPVLDHIMYYNNRFAEALFYFCGEEIVSARFCQSFD